ncbi:hypothetical protein H112_03250 [Trichophyton rubrum D6]|uniref:Uncharacterized protein n=4 Tax=Trichophyton TaxID=5550 RepID=A0A178EVH5_TRIRU|nr:uncharacterized protein TERG_05859 [Trichophyton rubrum CBS 118892]EZF24168.1 hypothetical protein H100_03254 [Trichophyton rubrum MR850]EZF43208.1 hypothetical protein H102_03247 [Trichophyton rubrum CBS 100081]EZF53866.1 hypothetical protein H103_03262 [Trichophyton rubrum CBS 288.86]EZF64469.1 hypothetical protein H104_03245 [Trichophyton rubrum CBS 289.86]EZF75095.1 hypothetical protein H105_03265 [Trichophyton soudanense CBS 452.61]EZF85793.1 hypothetical protein H110_03254 [Trichophy
MGPIRRYLRVSKYTVLECRIYLENPSDSRWLLDSHDATLKRVIESIRPLVQPKLREEKERIKAKKKSKPVKDVLVEDDFEVSIFLRESGSRHSLLTRQKVFRDDKDRITSNSKKMTGETDDSPIEISEQNTGETRILVESDDDEEMPLANDEAPENNQNKNNNDAANENMQDTAEVANESAEDKKKLGLTTTYDGFGIWGWVLCLIIKRKKPMESSKKANDGETGQALMEEWICTQAPQEYDE